MAINRWKPFHELEEMFEGHSGYSWDLAADVFEEDGDVIAKMHVPGIEPDNIDIEVEEDHLHVRGERKEEKKVEDKDYYKKEIRCGSFERIIPLPCHVNEEKTTAEYKDGVLTITMPKSRGAEKEGHRIKITR